MMRRAPYVRILPCILCLPVLACGQGKQQAGTDSGTTKQDSVKQEAVKVTADNFVRAETDMYFGTSVNEAGGVGQLFYKQCHCKKGQPGFHYYSDWGM